METQNNALPSGDVQTTFEVPLEDAQTWTKAWADKGDFIKAFLIDAEELKSIIEEKGASYLRVYFGWDSSMEPGRNEKLVMTPVDEFGRDMAPKSGLPNSNVFDFTLPCPPTCDINSPLYFVSPKQGE